MKGEWKVFIQRLARRSGYQIRRLDPGVDLSDPYDEQRRLLDGEAATIFEVGAADGRDCDRYAALFPKARIYAFEPLPESFEKVAERARRNARIVPVRCALSDHVGTAEFHLTEWLDASSLLPARNTGSTFDAYHQARGRIEVSTDTIDHFCRERAIDRIDLLKMDAQGAELRILHAASEMLAEGRIGLIYTEVQFNPCYEGASSYPELAVFLQDHGFRFHSFYDLHHNHRGELYWGDAIFLHRSIEPGS